MAPATLSKSRGRAKDLVRGVRGLPTTLFSESTVIDMVQGTLTLPQTHSTPPWCQQRTCASWPFGGVFVLSTAARTSVEGAVMR